MRLDLIEVDERGMCRWQRRDGEVLVDLLDNGVDVSHVHRLWHELVEEEEAVQQVHQQLDHHIALVDVACIKHA